MEEIDAPPASLVTSTFAPFEVVVLHFDVLHKDVRIKEFVRGKEREIVYAAEAGRRIAEKTINHERERA